MTASLSELLTEMGIDPESMSRREIGDTLYRLVFTRAITLETAFLILDRTWPLADAE